MPLFDASMLKPASQAGPTHVILGVGKLVDVVLLPLMGHVECILLYPLEEWTHRLHLWVGLIE